MKKEVYNNDLPCIYQFDFIKNKSEQIIKEFASDPDNGIKEGLCVNINNQIFNSVLFDINNDLFAGIETEKDPLLLIIIFECFIYITSKYNKIVSLEAFSFFSGVPLDDLFLWSQDAKLLQKSDILDNHKKELYILYKNIYTRYNNKNNIKDINNDLYYINIYNIMSNAEKDKCLQELTAIKGHIYNKIAFFRESGIKNKMLGSSQQLGVVAIVNREFGWSAERIGKEERARALTLSDLPKLSNYVNNEKEAQKDQP